MDDKKKSFLQFDRLYPNLKLTQFKNFFSWQTELMIGNMGYALASFVDYMSVLQGRNYNLFSINIIINNSDNI